nr:hypothetical protein [uncultured Rhodopila sp.]
MRFPPDLSGIPPWILISIAVALGVVTGAGWSLVIIDALQRPAMVRFPPGTVISFPPAKP